MNTKIKLLALFAITLIVSSCKKDNMGNETVADIDGNVYHTIKIGTQTWMLENLKTTRFNDGNTMITGLTDSEWKISTSEAYCVYNNDPNNIIYGRLYNWYAVNTGKLAPKGWHIPTVSEWTTLVNFLGGESIAGGAMKDTTLWNSPNTGATNSSGFKALPAGYRGNLFGIFDLLGIYANFWTSTENDVNTAWDYNLTSNVSSAVKINDDKKNGFSVRCIKD